MTQVGIYAGTFDPVHSGHIAFAREALKIGLDKVVFLPERAPRGKPDATDLAHRLAMLRLALRDYPGLGIAQMPHERFTVAHTLPELRKQFGTDLTLLMGSDVAVTLPDWQDIDELLKHTALLIALRHEHSERDVIANMRRAGQNLRFKCISSPAPLIASRTIRYDETLDNHLHPAVRSYANLHKLYTKTC